MATYLLTWNPEKWKWSELQESIRILRRNGFWLERWSCGGTKKIRNGDRVFLIKLGKEPRGIVASGTVVREPFEAEHWDNAKRAKGELALYIKAKLDTLLDPAIAMFPYERLMEPGYGGVRWTPQASGVTIPDAVAAVLEADWKAFVSQLEK
jgi:5-methylcytosine-specific restriction protein A